MTTILELGCKPLPSEKFYQKRCSTCGCKFTYQEEDIKYYGCEPTRYVTCPQCKYFNDIFFKIKYRKKRGKKHEFRSKSNN